MGERSEQSLELDAQASDHTKGQRKRSCEQNGQSPYQTRGQRKRSLNTLTSCQSREQRKRSLELNTPALKQTKTEIPLNEEVPMNSVCQFCLSSEDNEVILGPMYTKNGIIVHYFCLLLSSGLIQNARPSDRSSILGFTISDILKECKRGRRLRCYFCHKKGATIGCCKNKCRKTFHLTCGRSNGTMHEFFGSFRSFCPEHWISVGLTRRISPTQCRRGSCSICLMAIEKSLLNHQIIRSPCCKALFHHTCIQKYALASGLHYFRCPLCNAKKSFQTVMLRSGVFIPDRDASWETEPGAFNELLERPDRCCISPCLCLHGEKYDAQAGWFKLLTCETCGSCCAHRTCAGIRSRTGGFVCSDCSSVALNF